MTDAEIIGFLIGLLALVVFLAAAAIAAAYRNGVVEGYGYSREPDNPGYRMAGEHLRAHMAHRWPELTEEDPEP